MIKITVKISFKMVKIPQLTRMTLYLAGIFRLITVVSFSLKLRGTSPANLQKYN